MSPVIGKGARDAQGLGLLVIRGCGMIAVTKFCLYTSCAAAQSSKSDPHEILENSVRVDTTDLFRLHNFLKPAAVACHVWIILVRGGWVAHVVCDAPISFQGQQQSSGHDIYAIAHWFPERDTLTPPKILSIFEYERPRDF